ncbi:MAG: hypothetical protein NC191_07750 [Muribaculaceae bacterium]|nr:hypothetical protein [Muribaculaceae bacterium]
MLTISPVKLANYSKKYISFGENAHSTSKIGLRSLDKSPNARINFEKDLHDTRNADMVQSNPIKAFGYNLVKAYNILCTPTRRGAAHQAESKYVHIPYMA